MQLANACIRSASDAETEVEIAESAASADQQSIKSHAMPSHHTERCSEPTCSYKLRYVRANLFPTQKFFYASSMKNLWKMAPPARDLISLVTFPHDLLWQGQFSLIGDQRRAEVDWIAEEEKVNASYHKFIAAKSERSIFTWDIKGRRDITTN